eukprot:7990987-Ditylum_brightwellii.AAC.1
MECRLALYAKKTYFSQKEKDICPSGWFNNNNLREGEEAYNCFQEILFCAKAVKTGLYVMIPLSRWGEDLVTRWYLDDAYHSSMSEINADIAAKSVVLIGEVLGHVRRGVYDIALLCSTEDD